MTSFKERLVDGVARVTPDQPGYWTFSYVNINGRTLAKRVFVKPMAIEEGPGREGPGGPGGPGRRVEGVSEQGDVWGFLIWAVAIAGILLILIILFKKGRIGEPPRRISNILRATKYNITKK